MIRRRLVHLEIETQRPHTYRMKITINLSKLFDLCTQQTFGKWFESKRFYWWCFQKYAETLVKRFKGLKLHFVRPLMDWLPLIRTYGLFTLHGISDLYSFVHRINPSISSKRWSLDWPLLIATFDSCVAVLIWHPTELDTLDSVTKVRGGRLQNVVTRNDQKLGCPVIYKDTIHCVILFVETTIMQAINSPFVNCQDALYVNCSLQ